MLKVYKTLTMKNCKALHKLMKTYVNIDTIFVDGKTQYYRHVDLLWTDLKFQCNQNQ